MDIYKRIKSDKQIWKFCFYGFLKDLTFFEPYLLIYLIGMGMNLFKIGVLFSIREAVINIFEVPSGIFADNYGKKKELMICFTLYIISFIFFFIGSSFYVLLAAMVFFGLGDAFRSGTHKAMIYTYLEQKDWFSHKTFVYGRTRSFSLLGASLSAFLSIIFIFNLPGVRWIFLLSIIPYIIDFLLIASYPDSLDEKHSSSFSLKKFALQSLKQFINIFFNATLRKILLSSSLYDGIFKTIKDYIQPILQAVILSSAALALKGMEGDKTLKLFLGITYGIFYIFSSSASKNVYRLNKWFSSGKLMSSFFDIMAIFSIILCFAVRANLTALIIAIFFILYLLQDSRRPLMVDVCGDHMSKNERATVMSIDSQLTSLFTMLFAPIFGLIADYSISLLFLIIGLFILIANRFLNLSENSVKIIKKAEVKA